MLNKNDKCTINENTSTTTYTYSINMIKHDQSMGNKA